MNNFNPDQNPHILSSPETQEGGAGGINRQTNQAEQENAELSGNVLKGQEGLDIAEQLDVEDEDSLDLPPLDSEEVQAPSDETLTEDGNNNEDLELPPLEDDLNFDIDSETGLSTALTTIENLQAQIKTLEEGGIRYQEIESQIETERATEKTNLENSLKENETKLNQLYIDIFIKLKLTVEFTGSEAQKIKIDEYLEKHKDNKAVSSIKTKFDTCKKQIQELTATLATFDTETESQIQASVQAEKGTLQKSLSEAQEEYSGSEAEANDKKVLLERQLKEQLTDPNQLFSRDNITSIFATYGLKEGLEKLEELKQESDQAREQAARDEIRKDIMSRAHWYTQIPELAEALSTDIQPKLEALQESNPESEDIKTALSKEGKSRLDYLVDSRDPQLQELAFWFSQYRQDRSDSNILDEHPQFAQYVEKTTNQNYEQQQKEIQMQERRSRTAAQYGDNARRVEIDGRIAEQLEKSKETKVKELKKELDGLHRTTGWSYYDIQDRVMLLEKEKLRPYDIKQFQTKLQHALESGQIKFEKGQFSALDNIPAKQQEINTKQENLLKTIKPLLDNAGYTLQSLESLPDIVSAIDQDKQKANSKWFGRGKKQAETLGNLATEVSQTIEQYNALKSERQQNSEQFRNNMESISKLKESYQNLPQSIQKSLTSLENPNFETITQTINIGVESIQNYQTPPEIAEKRSQIQALESKIAETSAITAPKASTQSRV